MLFQHGPRDRGQSAPHCTKHYSHCKHLCYCSSLLMSPKIQTQLQTQNSRKPLECPSKGVLQSITALHYTFGGSSWTGPGFSERHSASWHPSSSFPYSLPSQSPQLPPTLRHSMHLSASDLYHLWLSNTGVGETCVSLKGCETLEPCPLSVLPHSAFCVLTCQESETATDRTHKAQL